MPTPPDLMTLFRELIAAPSVSCTEPHWDQSNLPVIELLAHWLADLGFQTEVMPIAGFPGKANLIATLGSGPGGLVLSGHTDTVPYDGSLWSSDPFKLVERDQRLYGLGTCDMKGFFALAIEAARTAIEGPLQQPLIILATADEETSMCGARALAEAGRPKARYAVIGEPTGLRPVYMHKGIMMQSVRIQGHSGHSSNPALGNNAMEAMHLVLGELLNFRSELQQRYQDASFEVSVPTLNLGCIHGGDNPNRICGHCELSFDLRPLPGMRNADLRAELDRRLQAIGVKTGTELTHEALFPGIEAFANDRHSPLVQQAERLTGHQAETVAFGTEGPFLQALGMDTIVLGPGDIGQAHQPDEYLALSRIEPTLELLRQLIRHYCLTPSPAP